MKALLNLGLRTMFRVQEANARRVNEAKFKLSDLGYAYGYLHDQHYWSVPQALECQCLALLKSVFPNEMIHRMN